MTPPLLTRRFLTMFGFTFLVFASLFQLLPVAPYRILQLGGTAATAGWFLGLLTFASAFFAPITGPICDRIGHRRALVTAGALLTALTAAYAVVDDIRWLLALVFLQGAIWSALMSASGAYATATIPPARRAEGLGYWGLASIIAIGAAPSLGFAVFSWGWPVLCLELATLNALMTIVAWFMPDEHTVAAEMSAQHGTTPREGTVSHVATPAQPFAVEWKVILLAVSLAMISFGYGGLTSFSALFADALGVSPRSTFLSSMAVSVIAGRLLVGRRVDTWGATAVLMVSFVVPVLGLARLATAADWLDVALAGLAFGSGFGLMWPSFAAYVIGTMPIARRGAAFGAILAAFDTGIGVGSATTGWMVRAYGFRAAYALAACIAGLALPYFLLARRRLHLGESVH